MTLLQKRKIRLLVKRIIRNDKQRKLKGSKEFMLEDERVLLINELGVTDHVLLSIDNDRTVCKSLEQVKKSFGNKYDLYFANGGDQDNNSIPEAPICNELGIQLIDGLGDKIQSSSWLLGKQ